VTVVEGVRESAKKSRIGQCVLEERLAELVVATDIAALDLLAFYTVAEVCSMLRCDKRTLKRRRDAGEPPRFVSLAGLLRCPAIFFWSWVVDEVRNQVVRPGHARSVHQRDVRRTEVGDGKVPGASTEPTKRA
jgi:hypothetical protein